MSGSTVSQAMQNGQDHFTLLRLALAIAVVVSHAFSVGTGRHVDEPLTALTGYTLGEHAVNGFFAVSGFLVAMSWDRRGGALPFAIARLLRVVPGLVVAVLLTALVFGLLMTRLPAKDYLTNGQTWHFIATTLFTFKSAGILPGVFENNPLRWPLSTVWTLRYELLCYAGLLLYGVAGGFRKPILALAAAALVALALVWFDATDTLTKSRETVLRLPLVFGTGSLLYLYRDRVRLSFAIIIGIFGFLPLAVLFMPMLYKPLLFVGTAYLMIFLALEPGLTRINWEPPGDISYGVYLYGWPIQQMLQTAFPSTNAWLMLIPALLLTCAIALASWLLVEKPALRLKNRFMPARVQS